MIRGQGLRRKAQARRKIQEGGRQVPQALHRPRGVPGVAQPARNQRAVVEGSASRKTSSGHYLGGSGEGPQRRIPKGRLR